MILGRVDRPSSGSAASAGSRRSPAWRFTPRSRPTASSSPSRRGRAGGCESTSASWRAAGPSPSRTAPRGTALAALVSRRRPAQLRDGAGDLRGPGAGRAGEAAVRHDGPDQRRGELSDRARLPGMVAGRAKIAYAVGRDDRSASRRRAEPRPDRRPASSRIPSPGRRTAPGWRSCSATRPSPTRRTPSATSRRARSGSCRPPAAAGAGDRCDIAQHQPGLDARRAKPALHLRPGRQPRPLPRRRWAAPAGRGPPERLTTGLALHTIDLSRDGRVLVYTDFTEYANIWSLPIPAEGPAVLSDGAAAHVRPSVDRGHGALARRRMARVRLRSRRSPGDLPGAGLRRRAGAARRPARATTSCPHGRPTGGRSPITGSARAAAGCS